MYPASVGVVYSGRVMMIRSVLFPENPPARMAMQVPLPKGLLISIGCVAAIKNSD
jgi:hypothetical protein